MAARRRRGTQVCANRIHLEIVYGGPDGAIDERLRVQEIELPAPLAVPDQGFNYELVSVAGSIAYIAGHGGFGG